MTITWRESHEGSWLSLYGVVDEGPQGESNGSIRICAPEKVARELRQRFDDDLAGLLKIAQADREQLFRLLDKSEARVAELEAALKKAGDQLMLVAGILPKQENRESLIEWSEAARFLATPRSLERARLDAVREETK